MGHDLFIIGVSLAACVGSAVLGAVAMLLYIGRSIHW